MAIDPDLIYACLDECEEHLTTELLPFWLDRCKDDVHGGFNTQFDADGNDSGHDEKSMLAQMRTVYSMSAAHRAGYGSGRCGEYARHGVDFLLEKVWDPEYDGFYWTTKRNGEVAIDKKIMYGPGKAANAGGVATSGLEMSQNSMRLSWTREEVDERLHNIMIAINKQCYDAAKEYGQPDNLVMGANIAGFVKVADSMLDQGLV